MDGDFYCKEKHAIDDTTRAVQIDRVDDDELSGSLTGPVTVVVPLFALLVELAVFANDVVVTSEEDEPPAVVVPDVVAATVVASALVSVTDDVVPPIVVADCAVVPLTTVVLVVAGCSFCSVVCVALKPLYSNFSTLNLSFGEDDDDGFKLTTTALNFDSFAW